PPSSSLFPYTTLFRSPFVQRQVGVELRRIHPNRHIAPGADVQGIAVVEGAVVGLTVAELQTTLAALTNRDRHDLGGRTQALAFRDRKSTRLNSSHVKI